MKTVKFLKIFIKVILIGYTSLVVVWAIVVAVQSFGNDASENLAVFGTDIFIKNPPASFQNDKMNEEVQLLAGTCYFYIHNNTPWLYISHECIRFIIAFIFSIILWLIYNVIKTIENNNFLSIANSRRFKNMAGLVLISYLLSIFHKIVQHYFIKDSLVSETIVVLPTPVSNYNLAIIIAIAFLFLLSIIFKVGTDIAEENKSFI